MSPTGSFLRVRLIRQKSSRVYSSRYLSASLWTEWMRGRLVAMTSDVGAPWSVRFRSKADVSDHSNIIDLPTILAFPRRSSWTWPERKHC